MKIPLIEENILSISFVNTNGPNIHGVGEKSPPIVGMVVICLERLDNGIYLYESDKSINKKYLHCLFQISANK